MKYIYRKFKQIFIITSIFLFPGYGFVHGQNDACPDWKGITYGDNVISITRANDNLWVGTNSGLIKFNVNTKEKTHFNTSNSGIPGNIITSVTVDSKGNKWVSTWTGLKIYDGSNWSAIDNSLENSGALPANDVLIDESKGNKWIGSVFGLIKHNDDTTQFYTTENSDIPGDVVSDMEIDDQGNLWLISSGFISNSSIISNFDGTQWDTVDNSQHTFANGANDIAFDANDNLWLASDSGLAKKDNNGWQLYDTSNSDIPVNSISGVQIDPSGNKWLQSDSGLIKYDGNMWDFYNKTGSNMLQNNPEALYVDNMGNKWFGTIGDSLSKFDQGTFSHYDLFETKFPSSDINTMTYDESGNLWLGSEGDGLIKYNGTDFTIFNTNNSKMPGNSILSIYVAGNGDKWIGTEDNGLVKYNSKGWAVFDTSNSDIPGNSILSITEDQSGNLWMGIQDRNYFQNSDGYSWIGYLAKYNTNDSWESFMNTTASINSITVDDAGVKWFSLDEDGIGKFEGGKFTTYDTSNSNIPLSSDFNSSINDLLIDSDGNKWMASSDTGLIKFDGSSWTTYDTTNSNIPENSIVDIGLDKSGNLWMVSGASFYLGFTNYQLIKFDRSSSWDIFNVDNTGMLGGNNTALALDPNSPSKAVTSNFGLSIYNGSGLITQNFSFSKKEKIRIYPNPAKNNLKIKTNSDLNLMNFILYDISGNKQKNGTFNKMNDNVINVKNMSPGIYFLKIHGKASSFVSKIVIK